MLAMTEAKYKAVCSRYSSLLVLNDDAEEALNFARELLEEEAAAVRKNEPTATTTIAQLEAAARELQCICDDIANEAFRKADT